MSDKDKDEVTFEELAEKPLSEDIIDQMAEDNDAREDILMVLQSVNPMQAQLIGRMLTTLKVEHLVVTEEMLNEMTGDNEREAHGE